MYATTTTGHQTQTKGGEVRIIRSEVVNNSLVNVIQTTFTESETYVGLSESDAKSLAAQKSQGGSGLIGTSLGGIKVTVASGGVSAWFSVFGCRGTVETATAQRDGDSCLWSVAYQKQTMSCTATGGTVENI